MQREPLTPVGLWQSLSVSKAVFQGLKKPYKVKEAIKDPKRAMVSIWSQWRLEGTKLGRLEFAARLLDATTECAASMLSEVRSNDALYEHLAESLNELPPGVVADYRDMGETLYVIVRLLKPDIVVETGVYMGMSSCFILQAEEDNGQGELYSIDLPTSNRKLADGCGYYVPQGKQVGWVVPENLKHRWHLILGDSREQLPPLLEQLGTIDVFLHDSLHTFEHQKWEYETAWPFIKEGGLLLSHDISRPFIRFCDRYAAPLDHYGDFGGLRKRARACIDEVPKEG
jgi:hypothetical protein